MRGSFRWAHASRRTYLKRIQELHALGDRKLLNLIDDRGDLLVVRHLLTFLHAVHTKRDPSWAAAQENPAEQWWWTPTCDGN